MAGAFGYEREHLDVSLRMAEAALLPAVRNAAADTVIVADGTSCRHQIHDGAQRDAQHVARVLAPPLFNGYSDPIGSALERARAPHATMRHRVIRHKSRTCLLELTLSSIVPKPGMATQNTVLSTTPHRLRSLTLAEQLRDGPLQDLSRCSSSRPSSPTASRTAPPTASRISRSSCGSRCRPWSSSTLSLASSRRFFASSPMPTATRH